VVDADSVVHVASQHRDRSYLEFRAVHNERAVACLRIGCVDARGIGHDGRLSATALIASGRRYRVDCRLGWSVSTRRVRCQPLPLPHLPAITTPLGGLSSRSVSTVCKGTRRGRRWPMGWIGRCG
jgi:hypothetical protein